MKRLYSVIIITGILLLAILLRFWQLGSVPVSPDWDEASLGYNAYSILKTGRDEYGSFLPLTFRSFDDYKPPLYVYLAVPSIAVFGLTVFSVRLPSAIFGVLAVLGTYVLVGLLVRHSRNNKGETIMGVGPKIADALPILSSLFMAISPWHIQFSRVAFEANVGLTFNIWAAYFFLRGIYTRRGLFVGSILFALALYAYHSERIFVPGLVLFISVIYRKHLLENKKSVAIAIVAGIIVLLPLIPVLFNKNALMRLQGTSSFREQTQLLAVNIKKLEYDKNHTDLLGEIFDNRRVEFAKTIIRGYLIHFSPKWLFITGDDERHHAPGMGLLYLWELPFILIGIYRLLRVKNPSATFFIGWFALAPIAASPTTQVPHAIRTLVFLPSFQVFSAVGVLSVYGYMKNYKPILEILCKVVLAGVIVTMFIYYVHMYFAHMNVEYSKYWQYGYKQAVEYAEAHSAEYKKIVVSTDLEQPYIFFLFYSRYDPRKYLAQGGSISGSFDEKYNHFKTYEFRKIDWPNEIRDGTTLYIGTPDEIVHGPKANITYLDGSPAINITDRE
ncbi:MAG: hypothetical protein NT149_02550 [Candidatus Gottesmanbacteria bacterium]|nr:hypothetical protein [Candidatus Gottesmanbacteria bacterium]